MGMPCKSAAVPAAVSSVYCRTLFSHWLRPGRRCGWNEPEDLPCISRWEDPYFRAGSAENGALRTEARQCRTFVVRTGILYICAVRLRKMVDSIPGVRNRIFYFMHIKQTKDEKLLLLAFAASALAACSDDDKMPTPPSSKQYLSVRWNLVPTDTCGVKLWQRM